MNWISGWSRTVLAALTLALSTSTLAVSVARAGGTTVIWETREGYVKVVPQDAAGSSPVGPNNHPVDLTEELLVGLLSAVQVRDTLKEKPAPLFTEGALSLMVPHLQQAFRKAGPGEDVTFVIVGLYKSLFGLANKPMATSGRLFYQGGKLNLIFGIVKDDEPVRYRQDATDRDFRSIPVGSRQDAAPGEWTLVPGDAHTFELPRRDWVLLDSMVASVAKPAPSAAQASQPITKPAKTRADRPLPERLATLNELKEKGLITDDEYLLKRREIMSEKEPERSPADRLAILNELKKKGLITDEEYRGKRLQILNDL